MKRSARRRTRRRGFTLIELLVVLGILVLLVALVTPKILGTQKKADIRITKTQIGSFKGALDRYHLDMKDFPTTEQGLQALVTPPVGEDETTSSQWDGSYLNSDQLPKDPWKNDYQYAYGSSSEEGLDSPELSTGKYPRIWSFGPDGEDGTEDDITSWKTATTKDEEGYTVDDLAGEKELEF